MRYVTLFTIVAILAGAAPTHGQEASFPQSVLITNDDGIDSPGLRALAAAFAPHVRTYVVAPADNRSGSTNYISAFAMREIDIERRDLGDGVTAFAVDGYPADAVALALGGLLDERPDVVISGINDGPNLANAWSLSGTVGAARTAADLGVRAIAVSGYSTDLPETLEASARWVMELATSELVRDLEPGDFLTVSIPRVPIADIAGVAIAARSAPIWTYGFTRVGDAGDRETWRLQLTNLDGTPEPGTDAPVYGTNHIVVVPMRLDENHYERLETLTGATDWAPAWPPRAEN